MSNMYFYGMTPEEAHDNYITDKAYKEGYEAAKKEFARSHGEWRITFYGCECSVCKDTTLTIPMNFCPNCGASMQKEGEME